MRIDEAINKYLKKVKNENRAGTYNYYFSHLNTIKNFILENGIDDINNLPDDFYNNFVDSQKEKKLSNRTINKRIELLIRILKYNKIHYDFFYERKLKENVKTFEKIDDDDLKKIMNYMYRLSYDLINLTYKIIIMLLFDTGVRINELLNIERVNINLDLQSILLTTTKTGRYRYCYFTDFTKILLQEYLKNKVDHNYLLHNYRRDVVMTYRGIKCFLNNIKKECNIIKLNPHMFRHTFATLLIDNGANIYDVMRLLGHTSVRTTEIYLHNNEKKNFEKYIQYHLTIDKII